MNIHSSFDIEKETYELIEKCVVKTLQEFPFNFTVDIDIINNEEIREINKEYRDIDKATDVLSFPMLECYNGEIPEDIESEKNPETGEILLGDILISYEKAIEQAHEYDHSVEREYGFLTVHSLLHLLGYDHERNEEDTKLMREKEEEILSALNILR